ncbi:MAG: MaoC/PaaZ C-terminal domain-containing protein [Acidimicrobiia bacterium]
MTFLDIAGLVDLTFGPHLLQVTPESVADFVDVTGDDPGRWTEAAPPGFMATALFVVAPDLLGQLTDRSVLHGEQTFEWFRSLAIGSRLAVTGTVTRARERGGVHFTTFEIKVSDDQGTVATGSSLFLISGESAPGKAVAERTEPTQDDRGNPQEGQVSASRMDLVRYAAATRDWNPVHWDHDSAVAAGLPGVVSHGLLQAAWAFRAAAGLVSGDRPLSAARVRFRNPLLPGIPVSIGLERSGSTVNVTLSDDSVECITAKVELSDE